MRNSPQKVSIGNIGDRYEYSESICESGCRQQTSPGLVYHAKIPDGLGLIYKTIREPQSFDSQMNMFEDTFTYLLCD